MRSPLPWGPLQVICFMGPERVPRACLLPVTGAAQPAMAL